nr:monovalent cation:proton antiporter-2 (CPA2) family protein [Roseospira visakhapatnamensis]
MLACAIVFVTIFQRLGLGSVLGYLTAGLLIGPWGVGLIVEGEGLLHFAELGVVFLLFLIGIELRPARLWMLRRDVFGLGSAQVMLSGLVLGGIAWTWGLAPGAAVIVGFGLALSSTAIVLQILADRNELGTRHGRSVFSILLLQDLAVVPLLALVSILSTSSDAGEGWEAVALDVGLAVAAILGVILGGRFLLRGLFRAVAGARNHEVFAALSLLIVLGVAYLMQAVGLSMAMGAFMAGLLLAESEFRHQVRADIEPFRGFLLGLFFMAVGMSMDFGTAMAAGPMVIMLVLGLLLIKVTLLYGLTRRFGLGRDDAIRASVLLCQGGEFGFVLFTLAASTGLLDRATAQILILTVSITMALTPLMVKALPLLIPRRPDRAMRALAPQGGASGEASGPGGPVIIAGYGRVGQTVARLMEAADIPYHALDLQADRVSRARRDGQRVYYGDASRGDVLRGAGLDDARAVVITLDQPDHAERAAAAVRRIRPNVPVFARARDPVHAAELARHGVTASVSEALESSLQLGALLLRDAKQTPQDVDRLLGDLRAECLASGTAVPPPVRAVVAGGADPAQGALTPEARPLTGA